MIRDLGFYLVLVHSITIFLILGASLASGHYIACVRAADINLDYFQCSRPGGLTDTATRIKHTKHRGLFKMFTSKSSSAAPPEPAYGVTNPVCGSIGCCGLKMNPNLVSGDEQRGPSSLPSSTGAGVANGHSAEGSNGSSPRYRPGGGRPDSAGPGSGDQDDIWLECDDEQISVITRYGYTVVFRFILDNFCYIPAVCSEIYKFVLFRKQCYKIPVPIFF